MHTFECFHVRFPPSALRFIVKISSIIYFFVKLVLELYINAIASLLYYSEFSGTFNLIWFVSDFQVDFKTWKPLKVFHKYVLFLSDVSLYEVLIFTRNSSFHSEVTFQWFLWHKTWFVFKKIKSRANITEIHNSWFCCYAKDLKPKYFQRQQLCRK